MTTKSLRQEENPIVVTIDKDGKISLGQNEVTRKMLYQDLSRLEGAQKEQPIYLKADKAVAYGVVVAIMADIKKAGFDKLGMITRPEEDDK